MVAGEGDMAEQAASKPVRLRHPGGHQVGVRTSPPQRDD